MQLEHRVGKEGRDGSPSAVSGNPAQQTSVQLSQHERTPGPATSIATKATFGGDGARMALIPRTGQRAILAEQLGGQPTESEAQYVRPRDRLG